MPATIMDGPSLSAVIASGPVYPSRFVNYGTSDFQVVQASNGGQSIGISQEGRSAPPDDENSSTSYAGTTGDLVAIYGVGRTCLLELGTTVTVGAVLGPGSDGKGILAASNPVGAIAKQGGVSGDLIQVVVEVS